MRQALIISKYLILKTSPKYIRFHAKISSTCRLSTITNANQILVLKEGEIIQRGKHQDLLLETGLYKELWNQQAIEEIEEVTEEAGGVEAEAEPPLPTVWHFRLWSFQGRDTKLESFLTKNQLYSNEITKF